MSRYTFTSESVTEGHPDKMADQISDSILDSIMAEDTQGRVACETLVTTGLAVIAGEISTVSYVDIPRIVRDTIVDVGYTSSDFGFDGHTCGVMVALDEQSGNISAGVDEAEEVRGGETSDPYEVIGAGDQGMMFGYACDETDDLMPMPIWLAHRLAHRLTEVRRAGVLPYLRPDGKTQVTIEYENGVPKRLDTILVSTQTQRGIDIETLLRPDLKEHVINPLLPPGIDTSDYRLLCNPTGVFEVGGPHADAGLTGRKIIVDTYGGSAPHGGGAFSGKDPTKVDRSAAYATRYVAKALVAAGIAKKCQIQVAYAIGRAQPVSIMVDTFGTSEIDPERLPGLVQDHFDLRPGAIIDRLDLRRPIFAKTAAYGHFGRSEEKDFTWEQVDEVAEELRSAAESLS